MKSFFKIRVQKHQTGGGFRGASSELSGGDVPTTGTEQTLGGEDVQRDGISFELQSDADPFADNDDVWQRRFRKMGKTKLRRYWGYFLRFVKAVFAYIADLRSAKYSRDEKIAMLTTLRRWDPDALEEHRRVREEEKLYRFHREQAQLIKLRLVEILTNLGFCYHITKNERKYIKKKIAVSQVEVSPFAYVFHITRMPFGVKVTEMAQDWVSTELSASIGKKIRYDLDLNGLRYTVEVGSTLSVPNFVGFNDMSIPKNMPTLTFFAGLAANGAPVYRNLADAPHMIIAGSSGGGKSNMENVIACTLIHNQPPSRVRFVFFDLKGGVEFSQYEGIPHLWPMKNASGWSTSGIVEYPSDVLPALKCLFDECMSRLEKLKKAGVKNISEFNRKKVTHRMPYIVVNFDEWASTKKLVGNEAENILSNIANLSRSAGIHFILSTQYPKAEIINTAISVNFPWRIAFNMGTGASQSVLGSWDAFGLSPVGRAVMQTMEGNMQIQTPRITNQNVMDVVHEAKTGEKPMRRSENVDAIEILEWSLTRAGLKLDQESTYNQFKEKITIAALRDMLRSMEGQIYEVQGVLYKVLPGSGSVGRRMVLAEEAGMDAESLTYNQQTTNEMAEMEA